MANSIVTLGDSIMWGQGLNSVDKFISKVKGSLDQTLPPGSSLNLHQFAHSASLLWKNNESLVVHALNLFPATLPPARKPTDQEISSQVLPHVDSAERERIGEFISPVPYTWCQLARARELIDPNSVRLVIVNGAINDIGLFNILLPFKNLNRVRERVLSFKGYSRLLLEGIHERMPRAKILITGNYPIVSASTDFDFYWRWVVEFTKNLVSARNQLGEFDFEVGFEAPQAPSIPPDPNAINRETLEELSRAVMTHPEANQDEMPEFAPGISVNSNLVKLSKTFETNVNQVIRDDVQEFNAAMGQEIARAALPQYSDDNCVYAPSTFLWELDDQLEPSDPIKNHRKNICRDNPLLYFACYRASLAHPNPEGAAHYADRIISEIENWPGFSLT